MNKEEGLQLLWSAVSTLLTRGVTETGQVLDSRSDPISPEQARQTRQFHRGEYTGRSREEKHVSRRDGDRNDYSPSHKDEDLSDNAKTGPAEDSARTREDQIEDPSERYARRPRHKTKADRYDYKNVPEQRSRKRHTQRSVKKKPGAVLNNEFQAPNIATERLTLKPTGPGFLNKAKSSSNNDWKGLPDLTFSEMTFLKRKRQDDDTRFQKAREQNSKKASRKPQSQEISEFFSRPMDSKGGATSNPKSCPTESFVSWSDSPPPKQAASTSRRLSSVARSFEPEKVAVDERDNLSVRASIRPNSSVSNRFLKEFATDALRRGVDAFAQRDRRYYSLEDLKKLAVETFSDAPCHQEPVDDCAPARTADGTPSASRRSFDLAAYQRATLHSAELQEQHRRITDYPEMSNVVAQRSALPQGDELWPVSSSDTGLLQNATEHKLNRISPYIPVPTQQPLVFDAHDVAAWEDLEETAHVNYDVPHVTDQLQDGDFWVYADPEPVGFGPEHVQPDLSPRGGPAVAGNATDEMDAFEAIAPFSGDLDEFDRSLLRNDGEDLVLSNSVFATDQAPYTYLSRFEGLPRDMAGSRSRPTMESDEHQYDSGGPQRSRETPIDLQPSHHRPGGIHPEVEDPAGLAGGFSGFSRGHILY